MRRITICLEEDLYRTVQDYAFHRSRQDIERYSLGAVIRILLKDRFESLAKEEEDKKLVPLPLLTVKTS